MSIFDKSRAAMVAHFRTQWAAAATAAGAGLTLGHVQMDNQKFTQPVGAPWGRLSIMRGTRQPAAVGATKVRTIGVLYLQIFLPLQSGTAQADRAADALAAIFDYQSLPITGTSSYAVFETVSLEAAGEREGYQQHNASINFRVDENL